LKGALRRHWNNHKYGASEFRFPHSKEFLCKLSTIWVRAPENIASRILG